MIKVHKKPKYSIKIDPERGENRRRGERYRLSYGKRYGDFNGGCIGFRGKPALVKFVLRVFTDWQGFDYILGRVSDPITRRNLIFEDTTGDFTIGDFFEPDGKPKK